jgi:glycosyltransferase involved in cell wall biosynthesis
MLSVNDGTLKGIEIPLISVIIPTYNRVALLKDALDSVYAQEEMGSSFYIEVIVIDDASSDATPEIVQQYPTVRYIRHERNRGASAARNSGISASSGKYLAFLDDDDLFLPHKLKVQVPVLESRPDIGVLYGQISISGDASCDAWPESAPSGNVFDKLLVRTDDFMPIDALLVRREAFEKAGYFDESLPTMEHYDMYVRLAFHVRFLFMPVVVGHGRFSKAGKWNTNIQNRNNERVLPDIIERALAMLPNDPSNESLRRRARMAVFSTVLRQRYATKDVREVRHYFISTLQKYPWMLSQPECVGGVYRIAGQLARNSEAPISAVRGFCQEVRTTAPVQRFADRLKRQRLLAGSVWRGAAAALWSTRSYPVAAQAAVRAVLYDPIHVGRMMLSKK